MLSYFRINDPYRLVIIFIGLVFLRLPYMLSAEWLTISELHWMIVGDRVRSGALLYVDIWDNLAPLAALVYGALDYFFGKSMLAYHLLGLIVFFFQLSYLNLIALRHKMFNENNYVLGAIYATLGLVFFEIITLSPVMLGLLFVLFSIDSLLSHIESRNKQDSNLINMGLFIGLAALFYLPLLLFILVHFISLLFFTSTQPRRYLLMVYGFFVPFILISLYYLWRGELDDLVYNYIFSVFIIDTNDFFDFPALVKIAGVALLFCLIAIFGTFASTGFNVSQARIQKVMLFCILTSVFIWLFVADRSGNNLLLFIPWGTYFLCHFFLSIRKSIRRELAFMGLFISIMFIHLSLSFKLVNLINLKPILVNSASMGYPQYSGKNILVLGPDIRPYYFGKQTTPYLNWELSKWQLQKLDYYDNLETINLNFRRETPDYLVDQQNLVKPLFEKMPLLRDEYEQVGGNLYRRRLKEN